MRRCGHVFPELVCEALHGNLGLGSPVVLNARVCLVMPDKLLEARRQPGPTRAVNNPYRRDQIERVFMKGSTSQPRVRLPAGMEQRLLEELKRSGADGPADTGTPGRSQVSEFTALYRAAIERLEALVAKGDGHPPMRKVEVDLLCRCLLSCETLSQTIRCAADFCAMLYPRAGMLSLELQGDQAVFCMDSLRRTKSSAACLVDLTGLFCYMQLFGWLIGQPLRLSRVFLAHPRREDAMPFLGLFNAPVTTGAKTYGFAFDATMLSRRVVRQPTELAGFLQDFPYRLICAPVDVVPLCQQVRGLLDAALARGGALPTLADLAAHFSMSEPTLRRRLATDGGSYLALREQCLREAAERTLHSTNWPVSRVAEHLGFASEEAFRRAFQRWTGSTPSRFRHEVKSTTTN